ncbi:hypothetical protein [Corynebacterium incognita]|nr:hypothetical protein [Corynebacterium incognita]
MRSTFNKEGGTAMKKARVLGAALGLAGCVVSACSMIAINEESR